MVEDPDDQLLEYGSSEIADPRDGSVAWPWTINVIQEYENDKISFELTGMPYSGPAPGEEFKAYLIF